MVTLVLLMVHAFLQLALEPMKFIIPTLVIVIVLMASSVLVRPVLTGVASTLNGKKIDAFAFKETGLLIPYVGHAQLAPQSTPTKFVFARGTQFSSPEANLPVCLALQTPSQITMSAPAFRVTNGIMAELPVFPTSRNAQ